MITIELLTKEDLENFRNELKKDIEKLILEKDSLHSHKLLRSSEVIKLLKISKGTLHKLRKKGAIPYTKMGRIIFFNSKDIQKILNDRSWKNFKPLA